MKNELTDVYSIIKREFNDVLEYFGRENDVELAAFLHYNAHNEMFIGTDDELYHNVNFKNLDSGRESRIFKEGYLYFFPKGNDAISPDNEMTVFSIEKGTKCIKINGNGLFIEKNGLTGDYWDGNIVTQYYDMAALTEIAKYGFTAGNIDYIENYIQRNGISPDRIISADYKKGMLTFSVVENGEVINQNQVQVDKDRTIYSLYYEFMRANKYYGISGQEVEKSGVMHR